MRNAIQLANNIIITTDNSGGIGEKQHDVVVSADEQTAYYATRVALLEQWAANAVPAAILLHNFSGKSSWNRYVQGITQLFEELAEPVPEITGSSETNMQLMQSAVAVTMIGTRQSDERSDSLQWYCYGKPLVGEEVMQCAHSIAAMTTIKQALQQKKIERIWPVGSAGIEDEMKSLLQVDDVQIICELDTKKSAGPATAVLIGVTKEQQNNLQAVFGDHVYQITIN